MKYAKITNGIVEQIQPNQEDGFIEVSDDVICGQVDNGDGSFSNPAPTSEQLTAAKWAEYSEYCNALTVTVASGNKYAADPASMASIAFKRAVIGDTDTILWVEDWGSFNTNKVELQEAITEADTLMQAKIIELFGA
jgi:hypothetical protein